ncbi:MAG: hypothetical protein KC636_39045, partial [Myxococcales bacterium]|nr:hypothetical protein [Myxococcales bacterium]
SLYAREHFARARARLSDDGVFVQWLPLYQLSRDDLAAIVRAFLEVFPEHAHAFLGFYNVETPPLALVGSRVPVVVDPARVQSFGARPSATIVEARDLLAAHLLDGEGLARFVGDGPVHHDLDPRVLFSAPRVAYEDPPDLGARTLAALLEVRAPYPPSMVPGDDPALRAATERYAEAVDAYLRGELLGHADGPTAPVSAARLERYLAAYEREPGFPPARGALFRAAKNHPERAAAIYERMLERTPDEPRVYRAYAEHLRQRGDTPGLDRLLERARARRDAATL